MSLMGRQATLTMPWRASLVGHITGTTIWHINADEPDLIDYEMTFKADPQGCTLCPGCLSLLGTITR